MIEKGIPEDERVFVPVGFIDLKGGVGIGDSMVRVDSIDGFFDQGNGVVQIFIRPGTTLLSAESFAEFSSRLSLAQSAERSFR